MKSMNIKLLRLETCANKMPKLAKLIGSTQLIREMAKKVLR